MTVYDQPITNIRGEKVALGPLEQQYVSVFWPWFNDLEVMRTYSPRWSPMTREKIEQWYDQVIQNEKTFAFTVYELTEMNPVGYTMLLNVNYLHQTADLDIIIGAKRYWGQGLGSEATRLTVDYGFMVLGLHNVMLTVRSFNKGGIRAYEKSGFREFGRRREARRFGKEVYDLIYMECLASEFESPVLYQILPSEEDERP